MLWISIFCKYTHLYEWCVYLTNKYAMVILFVHMEVLIDTIKTVEDMVLQNCNLFFVTYSEPVLYILNLASCTIMHKIEKIVAKYSSKFKL